MDPVEWASKHLVLRPWHTTFRTHAITNFSVPSTENASMPIVDQEPEGPPAP
ncbi:hypothetical protein [Streptomyces sp. NPDC051677]|uniref:hypothetical protein n=1 Tax=Streptomyces sp. NPDC051677 TaxID=3365669 RepID=UPI0037D31598